MRRRASKEHPAPGSVRASAPHRQPPTLAHPTPAIGRERSAISDRVVPLAVRARTDAAVDQRGELVGQRLQPLGALGKPSAPPPTPPPMPP